MGVLFHITTNRANHICLFMNRDVKKRGHFKYISYLYSYIFNELTKAIIKHLHINYISCQDQLSNNHIYFKFIKQTYLLKYRQNPILVKG